ncbi:hypothetical protein CF65_01255 [Aggregatibacter actinomycetemcomitans HK1651]|nr:hypothetical protein ANH9381_0799 [Aggregatibacter actinomycetemcomitans ANH9381]AHN71661.1 hypothetical protein CF65_01255 [Aggregatibacter actinomycetemcomitans HK1651]
MAYLHYAVCCDYTQINELQTLCEQCAILIQAQGFQGGYYFAFGNST